MKILVTGYKGFIGSHVYQGMIDHGHDVVGYDYDESHGCLPYVGEYDTVIHLGAISSTTEMDINKIFVHNYDFSIKLYRECVAYRVNFQYASSASVYGDLTEFKEDGDARPLNPYAWTKFMFDKFVTEVEQTSKIDVQGFRYFNVYGTNEEHKGEQASVFTKFQHQAKDLSKITLFKDSDQFKRDFVCVNDIVEIHKQMLWKHVSGVYNVGTGVATSFQKVGELFSKKLNVDIDYIDMPDNLKNQYQKFTKADNSKLNSIIDIKWTTPKQWIDANVDAVKDIEQPIQP
jgi:ADP-L-glycero-D-manno-heptose 6-epimerase